MTAVPNNISDARRDYLLAEFRCALIRVRLAQLDIEAVACALKHNVVTPEQAIALFFDSDGVRLVGLELGGVRQ